jgi:hypothetical protein
MIGAGRGRRVARVVHEAGDGGWWAAVSLPLSRHLRVSGYDGRTDDDCARSLASQLVAEGSPFAASRRSCCWHPT